MRNSGPILILVLLVGLAALALFGLSRNDDFDHSPLGNKGLQVWLEAKGIPVIRSDPHVTRAGSEVSLRILPLPISEGFNAGPKDDETMDEETAIHSLEGWVRESMRYALPTLIIMPKWRGSVAKDGIAQQSGLHPLDDINGDLHWIAPVNLRLTRNGPGFAEAHPGMREGHPVKIALYQAQTFDLASLPSACKELAGTQTGALLVQCENFHSVYLLSDPDLLNNHGLALAENAAFATSLIKQLRSASETRPVYLDTSGAPLDEVTPQDEGRTYERSGSDLKRFFAYPLSVIWGTLFIVVAICFWRGFWRFGPPLKDASGNIDLSKSAAIEATARLLRLSGNDGRMVSQFVLHLLADKAQLIFGPGAGNEAGIDRLFKRLARRDHEAAQALHSSAQALIDRGHLMKPADLHRNLETFRKSLGSIDFGSR